ncbi:MAG: hypothetical protein SVZ03_06575 [Spirochaetota bacterium]|nr:hypothetical protein [Spirochaetota bacterium]
MRRIFISVILLLFISNLQMFILSLKEHILYAEATTIIEDEEKKFNISGFIDLQYQKRDYESNDNIIASYTGVKGGGHFTQNLLNLFFTFFASENWLAFAEIRYLYTPTGESESTLIDSDNDGIPDVIISTPFDNEGADSQTEQFRYGSIHIERAYIEWNYLPYATFRFGRYFTPFGIWSQDHGAHIITSIRVPYLVNFPYQSIGMPLRQTGIEFLGKMQFDNTNFMLDYAAYIGNGVSNTDAIFDNEDKNKAFGGFLNFTILSIAEFIDIEFGCSGYMGERSLLLYKTGTIEDIPSNDGTMTAYYVDYPSYGERFFAKQMEEAALAHCRISIGSLPFNGLFIVQAEGMRQWIDEFEDDRIIYTISGQPRGHEEFKLDVYYIQVEYQIYGKVTPYFRYQSLQSGSKDTQLLVFAKQMESYIIGINLKPEQRVTIKAEWYSVNMQSPFDRNINNNMDTYQASITLAF